MKPYILTFFAAAFVLLFSASTLRACDCGGKGVTVDKEFARSENIVVAKLKSVDRPQAEFGLEIPGRPVPLARLTVERVFKGGMKPGTELRFLQESEVDCEQEFYEDEVGNEYLFYLGAKPANGGLWTVSMCSRSDSLQDINQAPADLLYLEKIDEVRGKTRISGRLRQRDELVLSTDDPAEVWLAGRTVVISGNGRSTRVKTDELGIFEVYDLPPGKYRITPERIKGYALFEPKADFAEVDLGPNAQAEEYFEFRIKNSVRGRLFDAGGKPIGGAALELVPSRGEPGYGFSRECRTGPDGAFEFRDVPAASYVLVLNKDGELSAATPWKATFYPGTPRRDEAAEITVGAGDVRDNLVMRAPLAEKVSRTEVAISVSVPATSAYLVENHPFLIAVRVTNISDKPFRISTPVLLLTSAIGRPPVGEAFIASGSAENLDLSAERFLAKGEHFDFEFDLTKQGWSNVIHSISYEADLFGILPKGEYLLTAEYWQVNPKEPGKNMMVSEPVKVVYK